MKGLKFNNARQANLLRPCLLAGAVALALSTQTVHAADLSRGDFSINLVTTPLASREYVFEGAERG